MNNSLKMYGAKIELGRLYVDTYQRVWRAFSRTEHYKSVGDYSYTLYCEDTGATETANEDGSMCTVTAYGLPVAITEIPGGHHGCP